MSNPGQRLNTIQARGGRVVVIDPRRTETAKVASEWVPIRPGSDVFFFLSFLHELFAQGGVDRARVAQYMSGADEVEKLLSAWPAERTEVVTKIPAAKLRELVTVYRTANGAAFYCSTGVNMGGHGSLAFWLQECMNALSGNLDRASGTLVGRGVIDFARFGVKHGLLMRDDRSRIGDFGSVNDAFPRGVLADEILTPDNMTPNNLTPNNLTPGSSSSAPEAELADLTSETATLRVPVQLLSDLTPGTVALPHGWGHQMAKGLSVASKTRGVNVNLLAADGPDRIERLSGMARLTGIPVDVRPAAGPQDPTSWSGIAEA